jgi:hypothetical protein
MVKKRKKDFINTINQSHYIMKYLFHSVLAIIIFNSCKDKSNINPDPINDVPVNITINLSLPTYFHLQNINSYVFENGGVKGIVIVHHTDDKFYAFDRACSFQPSNSCAKIEIDSSFYQFRCGKTASTGFIKCCDSRFSFDGIVSQGPAQYGLKQYLITKNGGFLTVSN